ncbi:MAG: NAD-dependent epimerase/dehydratase family protein [Candidatus Dadabacteria bacterium]|nr:NAD-dependent epimerase/dehydratase family protein [Candidatus Dadabacteria bacterium]
MNNQFIIDIDAPILITGSNGFLGSKVVETLLQYGYRNLRCFVRPTSDLDRLKDVIRSSNNNIEIVTGNLLSREDCKRSARGVSIIFHLAAGIDKSFPDAFMNSVVTTRNLLDAIVEENVLKRFINVSSFAVYTNRNLMRGGELDEDCEIDSEALQRHESYCYGKIKQDKIVEEYSRKHKIPYVIVRPGAVFGPGKKNISGRVGIDTFGIFLHIGGSNKIPLTYVDNCADAIVLAGLTLNVDGEVFNIVDDNLPSSRKFLKMFKKNVKNFKSIYVPYWLFYWMSLIWEKYSSWSRGQLPPAFNRNRCSTYYKGNKYSNKKLKHLLHWYPKVSMEEALNRYFRYQRDCEE